MDDAYIKRLEKRVKKLEEKQEELESKFRRLKIRHDLRNAFEEDRADYLEILSDTHEYYDY